MTRKTIIYTTIVDLSHLVHQRVPVWPGDPSIEFEEVAQLDTDGYFCQ